jgi:hypothetical protein
MTWACMAENYVKAGAVKLDRVSTDPGATYVECYPNKVRYSAEVC